MASVTSITSATATGIDVGPGEHLLEIYGTWGGTSAAVTHTGSGIGFSGLSALTADPSSASVIACGGEGVTVTTTGGTGISLTVRISKIPQPTI